jgi:hypothetical protein
VPTVRRVTDREDAVAADRYGVLVVRAWWHEGRLVARVQSYVSDTEEQRVDAVSGVDGVEAATHVWLSAVTTR